MCRFAIIKSTYPISDPQAMIASFATMAKNSKALDGDWQGDGWGIAWKKNEDDSKPWDVYRSTKPVWEDESAHRNIPSSTLYAIHVRSASFVEHKDRIEFNQPFISGNTVFVFNGLIKGVQLANIPGEIGSQKIWHLLQNFLQKSDPQSALQRLEKVITLKSKEIQALNVGLLYDDNLYSLNRFSKHKEYYTLHENRNDNIHVVSSEPFGYFF